MCRFVFSFFGLVYNISVARNVFIHSKYSRVRNGHTGNCARAVINRFV